MPCRVDPVRVNRTEDNRKILEYLDKLTHGLDISRENILRGDAPYFHPYTEYLRDNPYFSPDNFWEEGVPLDTVALDHLNDLLGEYEEYDEAAKDNSYDMDAIEKRQIAHRKEDIKRLRKTLVENGDEDSLAKTLNIDYSKPLYPQLGFDPDDF